MTMDRFFRRIIKKHNYSEPVYFKIEGDYRDEHWYLHGKRINEEYYMNWLKENGMDINNLSDEDKAMIDMKYR